jgi:hypothetical protein
MLACRQCTVDSQAAGSRYNILNTNSTYIARQTDLLFISPDSLLSHFNTVFLLISADSFPPHIRWQFWPRPVLSRGQFSYAQITLILSVNIHSMVLYNYGYTGVFLISLAETLFQFSIHFSHLSNRHFNLADSLRFNQHTS